MTPLKILSWNILHGGGTRCEGILSAIRESEADIVTLQEFRHGTSKPVLLAGLNEMGLNTIYAPETQNARENSLIIATRLPMTAEKFASSDTGTLTHAVKASIEITPLIALNFISVHFPQKRAQIPLFNALLDLPGEWLDEYSMLIGDFNCGIPLQDSETKTFYATQMFQQLLHSGWRDAWRQRHPDTREFSWVSTRKSNGFRYDHCLVSERVDKLILSVEYNHGVREQKASDHSSLLVELDC